MFVNITEVSTHLHAVGRWSIFLRIEMHSSRAGEGPAKLNMVISRLDGY